MFGRNKKTPKIQGKTRSALLWIKDCDEETGVDGEVQINYGRLWWDSVSPAVSARRATLTVYYWEVALRIAAAVARAAFKMCAKWLRNIIPIINKMIFQTFFSMKTNSHPVHGRTCATAFGVGLSSMHSCVIARFFVWSDVHCIFYYFWIISLIVVFNWMFVQK